MPERGGVVRRDQNTGPRDGFANRPHIAGNDRQPIKHRLAKHHAVAFVSRGQGKDACRIEPPCQRRRIKLSGKGHAVRDAKALGLRAQVTGDHPIMVFADYFGLP